MINQILGYHKTSPAVDADFCVDFLFFAAVFHFGNFIKGHKSVVISCFQCGIGFESEPFQEFFFREFPFRSPAAVRYAR